MMTPIAEVKTAEDNYAKHHQKNLKARLVKQHIEELNIFHTSKIKVPTSHSRCYIRGFHTNHLII